MKMPVAMVPLTGTWVCLLMSEKNDGSNPSLAIAISIRGYLFATERKRELLSREKERWILSQEREKILSVSKCIIFSSVWLKKNPSDKSVSV